MTSTRERLAELGLTLPPVTQPVGVYVPAVRTGSYIYTSGQLPMRDGALLYTGKVGAEVTLDQARECARQCALNALAAIASQVDLAAVTQVVKLVCFVASAPDFTEQAQAANGASELVGSIFGDAGRHARSAVGLTVLPRNAPVEVEMIVEVG